MSRESHAYLGPIEDEWDEDDEEENELDDFMDYYEEGGEA